MHKIVIINSKGGSGKTTVSVNLAAALAASGERTALLDLDPQGSSMRWLKQRSEELPPITGIAGFAAILISLGAFSLPHLGIRQLSSWIRRRVWTVAVWRLQPAGRMPF